MKAFQSDFARFEEHSVQVLGVSGDTLDSHRDFTESLNLQFPLLADDGSIRRLYGSGRLTYLIGMDGMIRSMFKGMPDIERLLEGIGEMRKG